MGRVVPLPVNLIWLTLPVNLPVITANYQKIKKNIESNFFY
jgi:hypothetical protein